jgi:hypothetical protein
MVDLWSLALSIEQVEDGATKDFPLVKWESGDRKRFEDLSFCDSQNDGLWKGARERYRPTSMTALVSPAHVAAHPGDRDQAMPPGIVAVGVPDTRPTARRRELHASDRKTAQIKAIQMKSFTVGRIDCDRAGAWSSMEWARSVYARRAPGRRCLLVRGFVRRAVKFDDYLTTETLAGQETSHERADG